MAGPNNYVEVKDRIALFLADYPEGSLQGSYEFREVAGDTLVIYTARAYRTPDDQRPAVGTAQEFYPGRTNFTKGSEIQNAETSAWGRALAGLGIAAHEGVASADDIRKARAEQAERDQLRTFQREVLTRAEAWASELGDGYDNPGDLVEAYLDAQGITKPTERTSEAWGTVLRDLNDRVAA